MNEDQLPYYYEWFPWWRGVLQNAHEETLKFAPNYKVRDIKEKFGELRLYLTTPELANLEIEDPEEEQNLRLRLLEVCEKAEAEAHRI